MATTLTWDGSTSGDVNVAANWTPAQVPIDGDSIIVDGATTQDMTGSLQTFAAMKFVSFFVGPDATIDIGTGTAANESLRFAATKLVNQGSGTLYYSFAAPGVNITNEVVVNSTNRVLAMNMLSADIILSANFPILTIAAGRVEVGAIAIVSATTFLSYRSAQVSDVSYVTTTGSDTNLYMGGGTAEVALLAGTAYIAGGKLTVGEVASGTSITMYISGGAEVVYNNPQLLTLVELRSGTLDLTQRSRELTITTLRRWPGTTLKTNELVTITTTEDMTGGDVD